MGIATIDDPRYVKALSHPIRVRVLTRLQQCTSSPVELAQWLELPLGTVAYHVRKLEQLRLIELVDERQVRGAVEHRYRALERPRISDRAWAQATPIAKQAVVSSTLQMIAEYAQQAAAVGGFDRSNAHLTRTNVRLDAQAWQETSEACIDLLERLGQIEAEAAERIADDPHSDGISDASLVICLFERAPLRDFPRTRGTRGHQARAGSRVKVTQQS